MAHRRVRGVTHRLLAPGPGVPRRLPLGPGVGIRLEGHPEPSLDQWLGLFESELVPYVRCFCPVGARCVDVGSYDAYYALVFAKLSRAPVRSYEPDSEAAARSRRNVLLNRKLAPLVEIREAAVGSVSDVAHSWVTLDEDLEDWGAPGLVKVDVEGGELEVLNGATRTLTDFHPHVIVETHSEDLEIACGDVLVRTGYSPKVVTPRRLFPQNRPREHNRWLVAKGRPPVSSPPRLGGKRRVRESSERPL